MINLDCLDDSVPYDAFFPIIAASLEGATEDMMRAFARTGVNEFILEVLPFTECITDDLQCGVTDYPLDLTDGWQFHTVKSVKICGECIFPDLKGCERPSFACTAGCSNGIGYSFDGRSLILTGSPETDGHESLEVCGKVIPCYDSCFLPKWFFNKYHMVITDLILARSLAMPNREWTHRGLSRDHRLSYLGQLSRAKADIKLKGTNGKLRWGTRRPWR